MSNNIKTQYIKNETLSKNKYIKNVRKIKKEFIFLLIIIIPFLCMFTFKNIKSIFIIYNQKQEIIVLDKDLKIKKEAYEKIEKESSLINNDDYKIKKLRELYPIKKEEEICVRIQY